MNKKQKEKKETPIIDGDARPDTQVDPENKTKKGIDAASTNKKRFESERLSDLNSLEDYKDAKK